jgi:hypothetical protein
MFKDSFRAALKQLKPISYYVNEGRTETSLLNWELEFAGSAIAIQENYNVFFLSIKPKDVNVESGIDGQWIASFFSTGFNSNTEPLMR